MHDFKNLKGGPLNRFTWCVCVCVYVCVCVCVCVCVWTRADLQILGSGDSLCECVCARADLEILGGSDDLKRARLFEITRQNLLAVTPDFAYSAA